MMGKLQVYKIEFDDIRGVYKPGQDVTGRLILELEAGINVRGELNNAEISRGPGLDRALVLSCLSLGGGFRPNRAFSLIWSMETSPLPAKG